MFERHLVGPRNTQGLVYSPNIKVSHFTSNKTRISGQVKKLEIKEVCHATAGTPA